MDELSDVVLLGKQLVSVDPKDWVICKSLLNTIDLYEWWDMLVASDDATAELLSVEQLDRLRSLRDEYDSIPDYHCLAGRQAARSVLAQMFAEQLSITQVAVLCNLTSVDVAKAMISSRRISSEEAKRRVQAEALIKSGIYQKEVARMLGFSKSEMQHWCSSLCLKVPIRNAYGEARKPHVRIRAMELYDQGLRGKRICEILAEEMPVDAKGLTRGAVSQWAKRSGRTESSTNARD